MLLSTLLITIGIWLFIILLTILIIYGYITFVTSMWAWGEYGMIIFIHVVIALVVVWLGIVLQANGL